MNKESLHVPQTDSADVAHLVASPIIGLIPFVGGADLFKFVVSPSLEKRKERWMQLGSFKLDRDSPLSYCVIVKV